MKKYFILLTIGVTILIGCIENSKSKNLDSANRFDWIYQVDSLIMPFWTSDDALGNPIGNFPAFRYRDGSVIDPNNIDYNALHPVFQQYFIANTDSLKRDFLRVKSRLVYGYCIGYHMTGNEQYLKYAKLGLDRLISDGAFEKTSAISFWDLEGNTGPAVKQRNSQDLAYALLGPAAYYYLTRDSDVLKLILPIHRATWEKYYEQSDLVENTKLMKWVLEDFEGDTRDLKDLIGPMDQLNAYLLLMARSVPDSLSEELISRSQILAYTFKDNFYDPDYNMFWSRLNEKSFEGNTDFGHSIKTFWMMYVASKLSSDNELEIFSREGAENLLATAYREDDQGWYSRYIDESRKKDPAILGFQYMELDQMAATLSFADTSFYRIYLKNTYPHFQNNLIDHEFGDIHSGLNEEGIPYSFGIKSGWFGGNFHGMEHALIGYLSTANYYDDDIVLYYAFAVDPGKEKIEPYHYTADIKEIESINFQYLDLEGLTKTKVIFRNIR